MKKIRLIRWFVLHVGFAAVPMLASFAAYRYFVSPDKETGLDAGDFLFFTFMISSIACGEVLELIYRYRVRALYIWVLFAWLLGGALWSVMLYAMGMVMKIANKLDTFDQRVLPDSWILAGVFLLFGSAAIFLHYRVENKWEQRSH